MELDCPRFGNLFDNVIDILDARHPEFIILENVPNLARHQAGKTWRQMRARLEGVGYRSSGLQETAGSVFGATGKEVLH